MKKLLVGILAVGLIGCSAEAQEPEEPKVTKEEYTADMKQLLGDYADQSGEISTLLMEASRDIALFDDPEWKSDMLEHNADMDDTMDQIEAMEVPDDMKEAHKHFELFVEDVRFSTENLPAAVEDLDFDLMGAITERIGDSTDHLDDADKYFGGE